MNKLDEIIITEIIEFLPNEDIFKIEKLNKFYNNLFDTNFVNFIKYRQHPLVFNVFDNLCEKCNIQYLYFVCPSLSFVRCSHNFI